METVEDVVKEISRLSAEYRQYSKGAGKGKEVFFCEAILLEQFVKRLCKAARSGWIGFAGEGSKEQEKKDAKK